MSGSTSFGESFVPLVPDLHITTCLGKKQDEGHVDPRVPDKLAVERYKYQSNAKHVRLAFEVDTYEVRRDCGLICL